MVSGSARKIFHRHLETRAANVGILSKAINKTLLVFVTFFTVNAHHATNRIMGQVDLYVDTTTDNLLELEHQTGCTKLSR